MAKRKHDSDGSLLLPHGDPMRCRYQSGNCPYPRVFKLTGEPHRLCKAHREKANASQRKLTKKQKRENAKRQEGELPAHAASDVDATAILTGRAGDRKCAYSNGRCGAKCAIKTNGCYHRFCEQHRSQAKKDQHNHVKKHQKQNQALNPWVNGALANLSGSEFQLISTSQPQAVDAVLTAYGRSDLAIQGGENWPFDDCNIDDLTEFPFDDFDLLDNVPFNQPMQVLVNDVKYDDAELLLAHGAPWLLEYIDEIYASLKMDEP